MDQLLGFALNAFGHFIQNIGGLMDPATLLGDWTVFFLQSDPDYYYKKCSETLKLVTFYSVMHSKHLKASPVAGSRAHHAHALMHRLALSLMDENALIRKRAICLAPGLTLSFHALFLQHGRVH